MGQKEKMHFVIVFTSFLILGLEIITSANAANKVRLISPTPYLFPELSISGRLFNFLPPFTTRAELSTKSKQLKENKIFKQRHSDEVPRLLKIASTILSEYNEKKDTQQTEIKSDLPLISGENANLPERINDKSESTKPFKTKSPINNNDTNTLEAATRQKKGKRNRHFIGSYIGGVGGVFPPVVEESSKTHMEESPLANLEDKESSGLKYTNDDSTCFHDNEIYKAGEMIKLRHKNNPCDKCRCEKREGGGIINCFWQQCEGLPALGCVPLFVPGACCPVYTCDGDDLGI